MLERLKVLRAILIFNDFTVESIAEETGVSKATIRTILHRSGHSLEKIDNVSTGRRGGQPTVYRVRHEGRPGLEIALNAAHAAFLETQPPSDRSRGSLPASLMAAQDALLNRYEKCNTLEERKEALEFAEIDLRLARLDIEDAKVTGEGEEPRTVLVALEALYRSYVEKTLSQEIKESDFPELEQNFAFLISPLVERFAAAAERVKGKLENYLYVESFKTQYSVFKKTDHKYFSNRMEGKLIPVAVIDSKQTDRSFIVRALNSHGTESYKVVIDAHFDSRLQYLIEKRGMHYEPHATQIEAQVLAKHAVTIWQPGRNQSTYSVDSHITSLRSQRGRRRRIPTY